MYYNFNIKYNLEFDNEFDMKLYSIVVYLSGFYFIYIMYIYIY